MDTAVLNQKTSAYVNKRKESLDKIASQMGFEKPKEKNTIEKKIQERDLKILKKQEKVYEFEL